jgi:lactoylglutathione lyase
VNNDATTQNWRDLIMRFLWTTIYVKNLEESIAFYTNLAELQVTKRFPAGPGKEIAFLGNHTDGETLVELMTDITVKEVNYGEHISIGFAVESVEMMLEKLESYNIPVHSGPIETPSSVFICVKDPDGLNVQFFQQKG